VALEAAAKLYGGTVREWEGAPTDDQFELLTEVSEIPVLIPPIPKLCSQFYEQWSKGGCTRRCDGVTEMISGEPCMCDPDDEPKNRCKITTRVSVMLPNIPVLGLWRLESHGWNAAKTLPGTVSFLARVGARAIPAVLRLEQRTEVKEGKTNKFVVPVIDVAGMTPGELMSGESPMIGGDAPRARIEKVDRPELAAPPELPEENPSWEGRNPAPPEADGDSDEFRILMAALERETPAKAPDWKKKHEARILALVPGEKSRIFDELNRKLSAARAAQ
jgi:hypothetical protein